MFTARYMRPRPSHGYHSWRYDGMNPTCLRRTPLPTFGDRCPDGNLGNSQPNYLMTSDDTTMTALSFTPNLLRHVAAPTARVEGATVRQVLEGYFRLNPQVRGYVLDDQGGLRKHVAVFLNQELIHDRTGLSDPVGDSDDIFVVQALSGG